jgi:hypothetical protein
MRWSRSLVQQNNQENIGVDRHGSILDLVSTQNEYKTIACFKYQQYPGWLCEPRSTTKLTMSCLWSLLRDPDQCQSQLGVQTRPGHDSMYKLTIDHCTFLRSGLLKIPHQGVRPQSACMTSGRVKTGHEIGHGSSVSVPATHIKPRNKTILDLRLTWNHSENSLMFQKSTSRSI